MKRIALLVVVALALAAPAAALAADVVAGSGTAKLTAASDGGHTVDVDLTNIGDADQTATPHAEQAGANCQVEPKAIALPSGLTTTATLTFPASCEVSGGAKLRLTFTPSAQKPLVISLQPASGSPRWRHVGLAFGIGFYAAFMTVFGIALATASSLRTELEGLGTGWSFSDNWVGNVTVGVAALVALFSSGTLGDVVDPGDKPVLAAMAVSAAVGAVFVALGPLILKLIGPHVDTPTVGGTLTAAFVTVGGAVGQTTAITWLAWDIAPGWTRWGVLLVGALVGIVTLLYVWRTVSHLVTAEIEASTERSDTLKAADEIVEAILKTKRVDYALDHVSSMLTFARAEPGESIDVDALAGVHSRLGDIRDLVADPVILQPSSTSRKRTALV